MLSVSLNKTFASFCFSYESGNNFWWRLDNSVRNSDGSQWNASVKVIPFRRITPPTTNEVKKIILLTDTQHILFTFVWEAVKRQYECVTVSKVHASNNKQGKNNLWCQRNILLTDTQHILFTFVWESVKRLCESDTVLKVHASNNKRGKKIIVWCHTNILLTDTQHILFTFVWRQWNACVKALLLRNSCLQQQTR